MPPQHDCCMSDYMSPVGHLPCVRRLWIQLQNVHGRCCFLNPTPPQKGVGPHNWRRQRRCTSSQTRTRTAQRHHKQRQQQQQAAAFYLKTDHYLKLVFLVVSTKYKHRYRVFLTMFQKKTETERLFQIRFGNSNVVVY